MEDKPPNRLKFNLERIMRTEYEIDKFQKTYFVIDNYTQLFDDTQQDFGPIYERLLAETHSYETNELLSDDIRLD